MTTTCLDFNAVFFILVVQISWIFAVLAYLHACNFSFRAASRETGPAN